MNFCIGLRNISKTVHGTVFESKKLQSVFVNHLHYTLQNVLKNAFR